MASVNWSRACCWSVWASSRSETLMSPSAIRLRKVIEGEWAMILGGIISILLGLVLFVFPGAGAISMAWLIGAYAIVLGILLIVLGFRFRGLKKEIEKAAA